jgi:hypothetical protein
MTTAVFALVRIAKSQGRRAENQGAGKEKREINFHALECGMPAENRSCLMDGVARFQCKGRDLDVELFAAGADHLIGTPH